MDEEKINKNYTMLSLHKAIAVLKAFSKEEPRLSLTELHKKTGISISSLQRFVTTLTHEGFLHKNERTKQYQLGLGLLFLGQQVEQESSILAVAKPILKRLNERFGESVCLNIVDGAYRRCLYNFESTHTLSANTYVGDTSPLYAGASAKTLLAYFPEKQLEDYLAHVSFENITDNTITSRDVLRQDLIFIRQQGYAITHGERVRGAISVSAPILYPSGEPLASLTIIIPEVRFNDYDRNVLIDSVKAAVKDIECQLH